tara:strand:- start:281 stop:991 length:711 start_codon:yes stop_codon:yes gene_type:complete
MSDFVNQVGLTLSQQLSALVSWLEEALLDLKGFFLFMETSVSAAWQLFLDDLSVVTNLFAFWINSRLDEYPSIKSLNGLSNSDVFIAAIGLVLAVMLIALSIRAKIKRNHDDQRSELTFEEVVLAVSDAEKGQQQQFFEIERDTKHTKSTNEKRMTDEKSTHGESTQNQGFQFFKKTNRDRSTSKANGSIEDDVYLLGIEQEMLATRQLYLDGLISKEVYISETRSLFQKAQTRMT